MGEIISFLGKELAFYHYIAGRIVMLPNGNITPV